MTIAVTCGPCKSSFRVKEEHAGKRAKCPRCKVVVQIPQPFDELEVIENEPKPLKRPPSLAVVEIPPLLDELEVIEKEPSPLKRPPKRKSPLLTRDILEAFLDDIPPVKRTAAYGVGILFLAVAMLVLPAIYIFLVAGIAFLLFFHATFNAAAIFHTRHWLAILFLYFAPIFIGVILLLFMLKPLFARRARKIKLRTLEFNEDPLLFVLVRRIAAAVGAPEPKQIDIDGQVNASARFGSLLGVLFGGDLVLTIGLPLVAGLSIDQLAGVIAHELGHFNQGVGMRLSYVVRSINAWFARIVFEGDDWDEVLAKNCEEAGFHLGIILYAALVCVWLTRVMFWALMVIGHTLSCFLLREMEYDADRNEARLVGADVFAETFRKLLLLQLVSNSAYGMASLFWYKKEKVPDDLSALILRLAASVPASEFRKIEKRMKKSKASPFDTHPSDGERLASVRQEDAPGVFHLGGPATQLFTDFDKLSRAVTLKFYRAAISKRVTRDSLVPIGVFLGEEQAAVEKPEPSGEWSGDYYDFAP